MLSAREALARATGQLLMHPELRASALADAAVLLMHTLAIDRPTLIAYPERLLDRDAQARYQRLIERRLGFEPIQYILGEQEFFGLTLRVHPAVLIPRPETELLVEAVLGLLLEGQRDALGDTLRIADVGTGSGAIAIALGHHLPHAQITALDLSPEALALARENARAHNSNNIRFMHSDLLEAVASEPAFDAIVSNPPYIPDAETLHPQVRQHEPAQALFAGPTGLEIYSRLIPQAQALLKPQGLLALEIGYGQQQSIARLLRAWNEVTFRDDLQQIPRVALARRAVR